MTKHKRLERVLLPGAPDIIVRCVYDSGIRDDGVAWARVTCENGTSVTVTGIRERWEARRLKDVLTEMRRLGINLLEHV